MRHVMGCVSVVAASLLSVAAPVAAEAQSEIATGPPPVLIFFDWGKPEIGRDASEALDGVASTVRATPGLRLRVSGHSDRSGSVAGNRRSATLRAATVAAYLADRGVPRSAMTIASFGEENPLIPTADGVREPQNRRVEVGFDPVAGQ